MRVVRNTGTDRVIDLVRPWLRLGHQLNLVTPALSLFALASLVEEIAALARTRLLLPPDGTDLSFLGSEADCRRQRESGSEQPTENWTDWGPRVGLGWRKRPAAPVAWGRPAAVGEGD
jgi:hypothetical protein